MNILKYFNQKGFRTAAIFTSGNFVVAMVGVISSLLYGRWIDPQVLGEFNKYRILTGYLGFGVFFVDAAFQRHFPYFLGQGDSARAKEIASIAKWWYVLLVWLGMFIFGGLAVKALLEKDMHALLGWLVQIPIYTVATYGLYLKILYRSNDDFLKLNKNMLIVAGSGLLVLPLVYFFQYTGLAIRAFISNSVNVITHWANAPFMIKAKFDKKGLIDLAKVSLPLQIPVYLDVAFLKASISLMILNYLGEKELGIYGMAIMMQGFLLVFSGSLNQIFTTKIMLKYGKNNDIKKTFRYIIKPTLLATGVGFIIVIVANIAIEPAVSMLIPKYIDSIVVFRILAFEMVFALVHSPFKLFVSALMYKELIVLRVIKAVSALTLIFFIHDNLVHIAIILLSTYGLFVISGYILLIAKIRKSGS